MDELYYEVNFSITQYLNETWEKCEIEKILDQFIIGDTKTSQQDLEYSIRQMVEIAARALSPDVNDPYTAITCIDNLTETMCHLAQVKFPSPYRFSEEGNLRIIAETFEPDSRFTRFLLEQFGGTNDEFSQSLQ